MGWRASDCTCFGRVGYATRWGFMGRIFIYLSEVRWIVLSSGEQ